MVDRQMGDGPMSITFGLIDLVPKGPVATFGAREQPGEKLEKMARSSSEATLEVDMVEVPLVFEAPMPLRQVKRLSSVAAASNCLFDFRIPPHTVTVDGRGHRDERKAFLPRGGGLLRWRWDAMQNANGEAIELAVVLFRLVLT